MSVYYPSGNCGPGEIPQYTCTPCGDYEYSRIRSMAFVKTSFSFTDPSDPTEWNTALAAGDAIVLYAVSGSYDGGSTTESPGFGDQETINAGTTHVITYRDPNVADNCDFYNAIKYSSQYTAWFKTSSKIWSADAPVTITPKAPVTDDIKAVMAYEVTVKWSNPDMPCPYDIPDGIFDQCYVPIVP